MTTIPAKRKKFPLVARIALFVVLAIVAVNVVGILVSVIAEATRPATGITGLAVKLADNDLVLGVHPRSLQAPFGASLAHGTVFVKPDATDAELQSVLDAAGAYVKANDAEEPYPLGEVNVAVGDDVLRVFTSTDDNAEQLQLRTELAEFDGVLGSELLGDSFVIKAAAPADLVSLWPVAVSLSEESDLYGDAVLSVLAPNSYVTNSLGDGAGPAPDEGLAMLAAIAAKYPVVAASIANIEAQIAVEDERDVAGAKKLIADLPKPDTKYVGVTSGLATSSGNEDLTGLDELAAASAGLSGVGVVRERSAGSGRDSPALRYEVDDLAAASAVFEAISPLPPFDTVERVTVSTIGYDATPTPSGFSIQAPPAELGNDLAIVELMEQTGEVLTTRMTADEDERLLAVELASDDENTVVDVVVALRPLVQSGVTVRITYVDLTRAAEIGAEFETTGGGITAERIAADYESEDRSERLVAAIQEAWND
jgi:hypothetical protein